jgi:hypothetical protein
MRVMGCAALDGWLWLEKRAQMPPEKDQRGQVNRKIRL